MKSFDYYAPETLEGAIAVLLQQGDGAYPIAGGTDLVTKTRYGGLAPKAVVSLNRIPGLDDVTAMDGGGLRIGAMVTLNQVAGSSQIGVRYPLLAETAGKMASDLIRNLATVGGNLCNAAPSADMAPALIALDAEAVVVGPAGERRLPLEQFFVGPGETVLDRGELLTAVVLPPPDPDVRATYLKHTYRQAMDIAIVGVATLVRFHDGDDTCEDARIVLGAVAPTPLRVRAAEAALTGEPLSDDAIDDAARRAAEAARPIDDTYSSAWYRRKMVEVLTRRGLRLL